MRSTPSPASDTPRPSAVARALESWFSSSARDLPWRREYRPFEVLVSEVMLQQTRMEVVLRYFADFIGRFPTVEALAGASEECVLASWSGLGYYRRARMLHRAAGVIVERHAGALPETAGELAKLPGIGRYTAGAIASIAFNRPEPAVDGNAARLLSRAFAIAEPVKSAAFERSVWSLARQVVLASKSPRAVNQAVMEIGSTICQPRQPLCASCPIAGNCESLRRGLTGSIPAVSARPKTIRLSIPIYIVCDDDGRLLMRRETGGLMNGMLHLPHGSDKLLAHPLEVASAVSLGAFRHTITNRLITFEVQLARPADALRDSAAEFLWISPAALREAPHPSYVAKAVALWDRSCDRAVTITR